MNSLYKKENLCSEQKALHFVFAYGIVFGSHLAHPFYEDFPLGYLPAFFGWSIAHSVTYAGFADFHDGPVHELGGRSSDH